MEALNSIQAKAKGDVLSHTIKVEGEPLPKALELLDISIHFELNHIPYASLSFIDGDAADQDFELSNQDLFLPGKSIEIFLGYTSHEDLIFKGIITAQSIRIRQSGASTLTVDAKDPAFLMTIGVKRRYFTDVTDRDAWDEIMATYSSKGLQAVLGDTAYRHPELVQHHATDWDFIVNRAEVNGRVVAVKNGEVRIESPALEGEALFSLSFGNELLDLDLKMEGRNQAQTVTALSWNPDSQELVQVEALEPNNLEAGNLSTQEIASGMGIEPFELLHSGKLPEEELQAWADAQLLKQRMAKIRGRIRCFGIPNVQPGQHFALEGVGDRFSGPLYISGIRHQATRTGAWLMDIQVGLSPDWVSCEYPVSYAPASRVLPAVSGLQIGIVTQLEDDPENAHRIQINLPILDPDEQGIWARVSMPDAGDGRGHVFRPEVGDEVLVGFINDDPRHPVVVGALHSQAKPAPINTTAENEEKGYVSREGIKFIFNEEQKSIILETPGGNILALDDSQKGIKLQDQNGNVIELNDQGITLKSTTDITIEAGANLQQKAGAQFTAKGNAGAELSASGNTVVKGAMVMIN